MQNGYNIINKQQINSNDLTNLKYWENLLESNEDFNIVFDKELLNIITIAAQLHENEVCKEYFIKNFPKKYEEAKQYLNIPNDTEIEYLKSELNQMILKRREKENELNNLNNQYENINNVYQNKKNQLDSVYHNQLKEYEQMKLTNQQLTQYRDNLVNKVNSNIQGFNEKCNRHRVLKANSDKYQQK